MNTQKKEFYCKIYHPSMRNERALYIKAPEDIANMNDKYNNK